MVSFSKDNLSMRNHLIFSKSAFVIGILLSGCSIEPTCCNIIYMVTDNEIAKEKSKYHNNIVLKKVSGGITAVCPDESYLQDNELRCALTETLKKGEYLAFGDSATYILEVCQESLDILSEGTIQEARIVLRVKLKNVVTDTVIFHESISAIYVSTPQDFKLPGQRMRLAIEEATKRVIAKIIGKLTYIEPPLPLPKAAVSKPKETVNASVSDVDGLNENAQNAGGSQNFDFASSPNGFNNNLPDANSPQDFGADQEFGME